MAKINEYAQITNLSANDLFLIETASGTRSIPFRFIQQLLGSVDTNTTYTMNLSGNTLTLTGSDGRSSSITLPSGGNGVANDTNTTYTIYLSGNTLTLSGSDGSSKSVTLPSGGDGGYSFNMTNAQIDAVFGA